MLLVMVVAAAACGGKHKEPVTPIPPEPPIGSDDDGSGSGSATAEQGSAKPEEKPAEPAAPPQPTGPVDLTIEAPKPTVKLVSPGRGKRAKLAIAAKTGSKQSIEIALDIAEHQAAPAELGGDQDNPFPTIVLSGDLEVKAVDDKGKADFVITVTGTDVRDSTGKLPAAGIEELKGAIASVQGLTISGSVDAGGQTSDLKLHVETPKPETEKVLGQLLQMGLPTWPILPAEAVGTGAKWQVTRTAKVLDKLDVTYATDYTLSDRKGGTAKLAGVVKAGGTDQTLGEAKLTNISGNGTADVTLVDGQLFPAEKLAVETKFDANVSGPPDAAGKPQTAKLSVDLKQAATVTVK